jgi:uncharacterized protein DUF5615
MGTMGEWKLEPPASAKEMADMKNDEPVKLYADHDVSQRLIDKIIGYGFSVKLAPKRGYGREVDDIHLKVANQEERCLIAQDKDYLTNRKHLRKEIRYGLIVIEGDDLGDEETLTDIADNCYRVLCWGKKFFERRAIFKIKPDSIVAEYLGKTGKLVRKYFQYRNGQLFSRMCDCQ